MYEGFITGKEAVATCEHVTFEPALERVLAEHLHDTPGDVKLAAVGVFLLVFGKPGLLRSSVDCGEPVGGRLIRAEDAERAHIPAHYSGKKVCKHVRCSRIHRPRSFDFYGIVAKVR